MIIELPQVGESVTEGTITQWLKRVGDRVEKYDVIAEILTDKVSMELPAPADGVLTEIFVEDGQTVPMGAPIAALRTESEAATDSQIVEPQPAAAPVQSPQAESIESIDRTGVLLKDVAPVGPTGSGAIESAAASQAADTPPSDGKPVGRRRRYSPAVTRLAEQRGVDLTQVSGTGINERITRKDVLAFIEAAPAAQTHAAPVAADPAISPAADAPAAAPVAADAIAAAPPAAQPQSASAGGADEERVPLSAVRRMIAANMMRSASEIPTAWSITEVDASGLVRRREAVKDAFRQREGVNITYLAFVVKAVAQSLKENPLLNSSWDGDAILLKKRVNICIAVAAPDGLVAPVIRDADTLSVAGIAKRVADLTARARRGRLSVDDVQFGTFTLNNTGALGSVASQPIINHPQAAILTTEAIVKRPVAVGDAIAIRSMMNICLTFDHRVMDGAEASAFANAVKSRIEAIADDTGIY